MLEHTAVAHERRHNSTVQCSRAQYSSNAEPFFQVLLCDFGHLEHAVGLRARLLPRPISRLRYTSHGVISEAYPFRFRSKADAPVMTRRKLNACENMTFLPEVDLMILPPTKTKYQVSLCRQVLCAPPSTDHV